MPSRGSQVGCPVSNSPCVHQWPAVVLPIHCLSQTTPSRAKVCVSQGWESRVPPFVFRILARCEAHCRPDLAGTGDIACGSGRGSTLYNNGRLEQQYYSRLGLFPVRRAPVTVTHAALSVASTLASAQRSIVLRRLSTTLFGTAVSVPSPGGQGGTRILQGQ